MGWHDHLMDRLEPLMFMRPGDALTVPPPPSPAWMFDKSSFGAGSAGTPNFRAMAWAGEYLRSHRGGANPEWLRPGMPSLAEWSKSTVINFFREQKKYGFMSLGNGGEQLCPDPHTNFWVSPVLAIREGAKEFGHKDVLDLTTWWLRKAVATWKAGATPNMDVYLVGARTKGLPHTQIGSLILRELLSVPHPGVFKRDETWSQRYYAAARLARRMIRGGDDFGGAKNETKLPYMKVPIAVFRYRGGHLAVAEEPEGKVPLHHEFCSWVQVEHHDFKKHGVTFGRAWETEAPLPPAQIDEFIQSPARNEE